MKLPKSFSLHFQIKKKKTIVERKCLSLVHDMNLKKCVVFNALQKSQATPHFLYILLVKWEIGAAACANIQLSPYIFGH